MKKLLLSIIALLMASVAFAQWRTQEVAIEIAKKVAYPATSIQTRSWGKSIKPAYILESEDHQHSLLYGFNYEGGGFILVSGCEYTPEVLGYADDGYLPTRSEDMPDGLKYLMNVYQKQIELAAGNMQTRAQTSEQERAEIMPLITSQWTQHEPYNNQCPEKYLVGCVAVGMGQIMNYYKWPTTAQGNHNGYDFSQKTWNWGLILDSYKNNQYTQEEADEVAQLLHLAGESVDMSYGASASAASSYSMLKSLQEYWKYDDGMYFARRDYYTDEEWTQILYQELAEKRPVLYDGQGEESGHLFLIDGYKENLFHVNWGWGGYCDGYFRINYLVPVPKESPTEFIFDQTAFLGIQPQTTSSAVGKLESQNNWTLSSTSATIGSSLHIEGNIYCSSLCSFSGKVGVCITDLETQAQASFLSREIADLPFSHWRNLNVDVPTSGLTSNHTYKVELIYQPTGSNARLLLPVSINQPILVFSTSDTEGAKELYPRRMVVEEGTGTWCQYCVWGIVGMEYMAENYPDNFIGIAVHSGDQMDIEDVYGLSYKSFPSAYFNRQEASSPSSNTMEQFLKNQSGFMTNAMVKITSATYSDDYTQLKVSANTRFAFDKSGADYRLAYVITEDKVGPYLQNNAYAGSNDEMGGFENLPNPTPVIYNDVARGIFPSLTGVEGSVPAVISACTDYSYEYSLPMPKNCDDYANLKLTVLLYDAKTGEIVNADRVVCPVGRSNIELSVDMGDEPGTLAEKLGDQIGYIYSLTLSGKINGTDLSTLRTMMGCTGDMKSLTLLDLRNATIVKGGEYMNGETLNEDNVLPYKVFSSSPSLQFIATPLSLKKIGSSAMYRAGAIQEVVLNEGLEEIGNSAFADNMAGSPLKKLNIPSSVKTLGNDFISRCYVLTDFSLDPNNPYFDFDGKAIYSEGYKELVTIIPSYKGDYATNEKCSAIRDNAISANSSITGIVASYVRAIRQSAFWMANRMQYVAIGSQLKSIGSSAFSYCNQLERIYLGCTEVPTGEYRESNWEEIGNCTLYVPAASIDTYKADPFWGKMKVIMSIEDTDYAYLASLGDGYDLVRKSISLSEAGTLAEKLGNDIYEVIDLTISGPINGSDLSVLSSMMGCNTDTKGLSHLDLANARLVKGGGYWFYDEFYVLDEDNYLPYGVFAGNQSLKHITLPSTLKKIGGNAFVNSWALEEIVLNEGLEEIGYNAFAFNYSGGGSLKKINLPSTLKGLGDGMLYGQYQVGITIDDRNPYLSSDGKAIYSTDFKTLLLVIPSCKEVYTLHEKCNSIQQISSKQLPGLIAPNITNIGFCAFWYCNEMTLLAIGSKLQTIEVQAFGHCDQLRSIYLGCTNIPTGGYKDIIWDKIDNCTLYVPSVSIDKYKADTFWGKMKDIKPIEGTEYEYLMEQKEEPTVTFTDDLGNTYDEEAILVMDNYEKSVFGDYVSLKGLNIKNISEQDTNFRLTASISQIPGGSFQCCLGDACHRMKKPGVITIEGISNVGGELIPVIDTEWYIENGRYGTLEVIFTLETNDGGQFVNAGSVTVQFVYTYETGIEMIDTETNQVDNVYTIDGRRAKNPSKGLYIINGRKVVK